MAKILVLEDEESIRSFILINLKRNNFDVIEAGSGEEALEKLDEAIDKLQSEDISLEESFRLYK